MKKYIIILFTLLLTSCSRIKIQDYLYPISIGIDYQNNEFEVYMQLVSYSLLSKKENEANYDENYEMIILNSKGKTIFDALTNLQNLTKNFISTTHIRSFIIGENLIKNRKDYLEIIRAFFDNNYLRSNINIYSTSSIKEVYKAGKIIDNTPYSNEINSPNSFRYLKPMNYLNFLKNIFDNRTAYLPFVIVDKDSTSYVEGGEIKENYIIEIDGAYYINTNSYKYLDNQKLIGNFYFLNKKYARIEIENKFYLDIRKLTHSINYDNDKIIFNIILKNCTFYIYNISYDECLSLLKDKIKKDILYTYNNCYDDIDIFHLNDYKNRYKLNNEYDLNIIIKHVSLNYSSMIK